MSPVPSPGPVPLPARMSVDAGAPPFRLSGAAIAGTRGAAELARLVRARTGLDLAFDDGGAVRFSLGAGDPESYRIAVDAASVEVVGADEAGLFYAAHTLSQLLARDDEGWMLPAAAIADRPRFAYRGVMLDVARHFFAVADVCAFIDRAASLKLNHLHLHLTDDQGWRLALSSRPALAERASATAAGGDAGGHYTADDYATIVAYAAARHVTVVPEVDVPGHTHAVGLAHPELAADPVVTDEVRRVAAEHGGGLPTAGEPYTGIAVGFSSLRTGDERTWAFVEDVFGELALLTPGPYLHFGGDEALGTDRADYEAFVRRVVGVVAATGKQPVAWHEAGRVTGLPAPLVAQYWGYTAPVDDAADAARAVAAAGGHVILSPADAVYLDMKPHAASPLGLTWANGPTSVADAYGWEPTEIVEGIDEAAILGVEAPLWTETVGTLDDIDALAFPRIAAAAEIAWSARSAPERTWGSFRTRVGALAPVWTAAGIRFARSPEIAWHDG